MSLSVQPAIPRTCNLPDLNSFGEDRYLRHWFGRSRLAGRLATSLKLSNAATNRVLGTVFPSQAMAKAADRRSSGTLDPREEASLATIDRGRTAIATS